MKKFSLFYANVFIILCLLSPKFLYAETAASAQERFILVQDTGAIVGLTPEKARYVADAYIENLGSVADEVEQFFNYVRKEPIFLHLTPKYKYVRDIKAPGWAGALFTANAIIVPVGSDSIKELQNTPKIQQVLRHEYVHALVYELSGGQCAVWLDEGLAQMLEGNSNSKLAVSLKAWLRDNNSIPLNQLDNGFINLDKQHAPIVYAQSLYATKFLISKYGMTKVVAFLQNLKHGIHQTSAFKLTFGVTVEEFDNALSKSLEQWFKAGETTI